MAVYPERRKGKLSGKWIAEVTQHGERQRKRFDTKRDADRWADFKKLTGEAPPAPVEDLGPTFGDVAKDMLAARDGYDKSGLLRLMHVIDAIGRDTPIREVTTETLDKLVKTLRTRKGQRTERLATGTINRYLSAASGVLKYALDRRIIGFMPKVPWQEDKGKRIHWLTEEAEEKIVGWLDLHGFHDDANTVRILTETGMRWGEFASVTAEQVEPETGWVRLWETKNGDVRSAPISPETARTLRWMIETNRRPDYYTFRERLKRAAKSAGQSEGFSVHALRHTTATRLIAKQVPLPIVQKYLGHKTIQTTMKYVHVADDDLQEARKKISPQAGQSAKVLEFKRA